MDFSNNPNKKSAEEIRLTRDHLVILWIIVSLSLALSIFQFYFYSDPPKTEDPSVLFAVNIAILSVFIIVVALILAVTGLGKLQSIEEKAEEIASKTAEEIASKVATEVAGEIAREHLSSLGKGKVFLYKEEEETEEKQIIIPSDI